MRLLCTLLALLLAAHPAISQTEPPAKLRAGIFVRPPFAMKDSDGKWVGLAVDVWESVSSELNLPYEYVETTLDEAIKQTAEGKLDIVDRETGLEEGADEQRMRVGAMALQGGFANRSEMVEKTAVNVVASFYSASNR